MDHATTRPFGRHVLGSPETETALLRFLAGCPDWQRTARVLLARFDLLALRAAQKHGYVARSKHVPGKPLADEYRLTREGRRAVEWMSAQAAE